MQLKTTPYSYLKGFALFDIYIPANSHALGVSLAPAG